jgi:hypothetical protein
VRALAPILVAAALPCAAAAAPPAFDEFETEARVTSVAMGALPRGEALAAVDVGWLRSGLHLALGLGAGFELVLRGDAMLLYDGFGAQNAFHAGVRFTPVREGTIRLTGELTGGQLLSPKEIGFASLTTVRGEVVAGVVLDLGNAYARVALRGVQGSVPAASDWRRDEEIGLGVERVFGRVIVGAEGFMWARPGHDGLGQWRLRVGYAL